MTIPKPVAAASTDCAGVVEARAVELLNQPAALISTRLNVSIETATKVVIVRQAIVPIILAALPPSPTPLSPPLTPDPATSSKTLRDMGGPTQGLNVGVLVAASIAGGMAILIVGLLVRCAYRHYHRQTPRVTLQVARAPQAVSHQAFDTYDAAMGADYNARKS